MLEFIRAVEKEDDEPYSNVDSEYDDFGDSSEVTEPVAKIQKTDFELYIQEKIKSRGKHIALTDQSLTVKMEVTRYLSTAVESIFPRDYWLNPLSKSSYPRLSQFARRFVICPTGSSEVERLFSTAGTILTKYRKTLTSENFKMLLTLNKNIRLMNPDMEVKLPSMIKSINSLFCYKLSFFENISFS